MTITIHNTEALVAGEVALNDSIVAASREPGFRPHRYVAQGTFLGETRAVVDAVTPLIIEQVGTQIIDAIKTIDTVEFALDGEAAGERVIRLIRDLTAPVDTEGKSS